VWWQLPRQWLLLLLLHQRLTGQRREQWRVGQQGRRLLLVQREGRAPWVQGQGQGQRAWVLQGGPPPRSLQQGQTPLAWQGVGVPGQLARGQVLLLPQG
jgi:hypothetical protein